VARAVFSLNAHCRTVFSLSDEKDVHLMSQHSPIDSLKLNDESKDVKCAASII
jgi:hypothetical protein